MMAESKSVSTTVLVTGGSGLVGHGIQWLMGTQSGGPTARRDGENWVFLSSADGDLRQGNPSILPSHTDSSDRPDSAIEISVPPKRFSVNIVQIW